MIGKREGILHYLKKGWGESRWQRVARYRLGNEMGKGRYWEEEDRRKCRVCGWGKETWEYESGRERERVVIRQGIV